MKKLMLSFALLLLLAAQSKAQTSVYYPFPDSAAVWNETIVGYNDTCDKNVYYFLSIQGDTTINSTAYLKLWETGYSYSVICDTTINYSNVYTAAIRQDTSLKEVFIVPQSSSTESLLFDFNLKAGDTLPATYEGATNYNYVLSVDSVLIGNNYRKSFGISLLDSTYSYFSLIEGIGSSFGLIAPLSPPGEYSYLLNCFTQNGQTLYPDSSYSCGSLTNVKEEAQGNAFSLYPNPAGNELIIKSPELPIKEIGIYNVLGEKMIPCSISFEEGRSEVYVGNLPAGIYFVQLTTEKERWLGRFVKE